jgi:hypothetical protein
VPRSGRLAAPQVRRHGRQEVGYRSQAGWLHEQEVAGCGRSRRTACVQRVALDPGSTDELVGLALPSNSEKSDYAYLVLMCTRFTHQKHAQASWEGGNSDA